MTQSPNSPRQSDARAAEPHPQRRLPQRPALVSRKQAARRQARRRIAARTQVPLTQAQKALDPIARKKRTAISLAIAGGAMLGSLLLHVGGLGSTLLLAKLGVHAPTKVEQPVKIEVREPPPEPPKVAEELPPAPADVPAPEKPKPKIKVARALPPAPEPKTPPPPAATPPARVVGLSLESTNDSGDGPSFAVGNTREGSTGKRAADPKNVVAGATGPIVEQPTANQAATRIPVGGIVYKPAKQRQPQLKPHYPETLKSQGIEGIVKVMVKVDATGKVTDVKVLSAPPYPEFREEALKAARAQTWEPASKDGASMPTTATYDYKFFLEDGQ